MAHIRIETRKAIPRIVPTFPDSCLLQSQAKGAKTAVERGFRYMVTDVLTIGTFEEGWI